MFRYKVSYYDKDESRSIIESGIVAGASYGEAANRLVEIYGKEDINVMGLYELDSWLTDGQLREELEEEIKF